LDFFNGARITFRAGGGAQVAEHLPHEFKALSSNHSTAKKNKTYKVHIQKNW
jgi:hypothetical protein